MQSNVVSIDGLEYRIQCDVDFYVRNVPERVAIAWMGYLSALLEWNLLTISEYSILTKMLPKVEDNPVVAIMLGRDDAESLE